MNGSALPPGKGVKFHHGSAPTADDVIFTREIQHRMLGQIYRIVQVCDNGRRTHVRGEEGAAG